MMKKRIICILLSACVALSLFTGCAQLIDVALSALAEGTAQSDDTTQSGGMIDEVPVTDAEAQAQTQQPEETSDEAPAPEPTQAAEDAKLDENGYYYSRDDVALYIHTYGRLPDNFITKDEARALGWEGGGLSEYAPDMCIGGDRFGNYEGTLPKASGRRYTECDIDTIGKSKRGAKRIVFSNDGLIYYTDDHYETFTLLYGEE